MCAKSWSHSWTWWTPPNGLRSCRYCILNSSKKLAVSCSQSKTLQTSLVREKPRFWRFCMTNNANLQQALLSSKTATLLTFPTLDAPKWLRLCLTGNPMWFLLWKRNYFLYREPPFLTMISISKRWQMKLNKLCIKSNYLPAWKILRFRKLNC